MRPWIASIAVLALTVGGCGGGTSAILLTVDSVQPVPGIDHLRVVVTNNGQSSMSTDIPLTGRPVTIPPSHTVQLRFADGRSGSATVQVDAMDGKNKVLTSGKVDGEIKVGAETTATVNLGGGMQSLDLGMPDAGMPDSVMPDSAAPDIAMPHLSFASPVKYGTGSQPGTLVIGDVNGDARADVVVADSGDKTIAVLLGNGDGSLRSYYTYLVGGSPRSVVIADFNKDGKKDFAACNGADATITTYVTNKLGAYQRSTLMVGPNPWSIATADMNRDGNSDIIVTSIDGNSTGVILGNGDGTFQPVASATTSGGPWNLAIGDVNGDGLPDVAVALTKSRDGILLVNQGNGLLTATISFGGTSWPSAVALADLNNDAKLDLISSNLVTQDVVVRLGDGKGGFLPAGAGTPASQVAATVAVADIDADGKPDVVVTDVAAGSVGVLRGNGDGSFQPQVTFATGKNAHGLDIADLNGDFRLDLVISNVDENNVVVLLNTSK